MVVALLFLDEPSDHFAKLHQVAWIRALMYFPVIIDHISQNLLILHNRLPLLLLFPYNQLQELREQRPRDLFVFDLAPERVDEYSLSQLEDLESIGVLGLAHFLLRLEAEVFEKPPTPPHQMLQLLSMKVLVDAVGRPAGGILLLECVVQLFWVPFLGVV